MIEVNRWLYLGEDYHTPGSPMTRRYAKYLASAQQNIADRSQSVMDEMLGQEP